MALVQDDHVVQANTANEPLDVRILPRTPGGNEHFSNAQVLHPLPKGGAIDAIPVAHELAWRFVPRERVHHLLRGPLCRRMFRDVEMDDTAPFMGQDEQHEEYVVSYRRHDKEIQSDQVLHMMREKSLPRRRRRLGWPYPVLLHRRLGHLNAHLPQFPHNPWRAPRGIRLPHGLDELADLLGNRWTAGPALLAQLRQWP
jgi:hypothetical protein